jgi:DNA-binding response OmpR family regulator
MPANGGTRFVTVVLVEDDVQTARAHEVVLGLDGFQVFLSHDAESGLRQIYVCRPDLVLIDLQPSPAQGLRLVREVRAREALRDTSIAIITGNYTIHSSEERALKELQAHLFYKPLWLEHIIVIARKLAGRRM